MARTAARGGKGKAAAAATEEKPARSRRAQARTQKDVVEDNAASRRAAREEADAILAAKVYELRDGEELSWSDIAAQLGFGDGNATGRLQFLFEEELVRRTPRLRITAKTEEELGTKIRKARDNDQLSWGKIMARTGLGLQRVRNLYEEAGGTALGNRIGKGGRHPGTGAPTASAKSKRGKATPAAKPAKARRARSR